MTAGDPTDNALATIASILEAPASQGVSERAETGAGTAEPEPAQIEGYTKTGPGPMPSLRLRWTVRRADDNTYYVDETIGENSAPVVSGPMSAESAMVFVNERERAAQFRFEQLKNEMADRAAGPKGDDDL